MIARWTKLLAVAVLLAGFWAVPAWAQGTAQNRRPVIEYIVVVFLLAVPIGLVCRSSRRST